MKIDSPSRFKLGPFEVNANTGELRPTDRGPDAKGAFLQEKSLRVLRMLIERQGELVLREEIQKALWPNDTVVDFDHGIHVAVASLRRALGDTAASPQYIETVPRRGYRLLVPVERAGPAQVPDAPRLDEIERTERDAHATGLIGKMVSRFWVQKTLGSGGMGTVYEAEDTKLGRRVALKVLPQEMADDPAALKRFEREARTASSLSHRNICTIYSVEEFERQPVIVMELLRGETLRDRLARAAMEPLSLDEILDIAKQTCDGLAAAHSSGIIHRDIKPANLFLISTDQTAARCVKILDFGLAKLIAAEISTEGLAENAISMPGSNGHLTIESEISTLHPGGAAGTASYMSPEQVRNETLDARTDLFSFGLVLYEMATGQRAFSGDDPVGVRDTLFDERPVPVRRLNPLIPASLESVIDKALQKNRHARYQSAQELRAALDAARTPPRSRHKAAIAILLASAVLAIAVPIFLSWRSGARFRLAANDAIVIADTTNQTSDPVLGDAMSTALQIEFAQSPFFQVLAQDKIRQTMQSLHFPVDASVTPDVALKVCLDTNSKVVITSDIADEGNNFHIQLAAINCQSGKIFAKTHADAATRDQIIQELGNAAIALRRLTGEPKSSIAQYDTPLEIATSSSPEALHLLSQGVKNFYSSDITGTTVLFERAVQIDPSFALAYAVEGAYDMQFGRVEDSKKAEAMAHNLRDRLTGGNKYMSDVLYLAINFGDIAATYPEFEEWIKTFPYDGVAHESFGYYLLSLGQYERSAVESREATRLLPQLSPAAYYNLMVAMVNVNRLGEARAVYEEAASRKMDSVTLHEERHLLAFLEQDDREMQAQLDDITRITNEPILAEFREADVDTYYGKFARASYLLRRGLRGKDSFHLSRFEFDLALQEAESGDMTAARKILARVTDGTSRIPEFEAFVLARAGQVQKADAIANRLNQESPRDTLVQHFLLPCIRAAILLNQNDSQGAVEALKPAQAYDLAFPLFLNEVYPAYLRGLALLSQGNGRAAAVEFQKVIDHPGIVGRQALGAIVWVQLARAQKQAGDLTSARQSYVHFLKLWQHADSNVPIYKQAKIELAQLREFPNRIKE